MFGFNLRRWRKTAGVSAASLSLLVAQLVAAPSAHAGIVYEDFATASAHGGLDDPLGLTTDALRNVYVADSHHHRIVRFAEDGSFALAFGQGSPETAGTDGHLYYPGDVAWFDHRVYVADTTSGLVQEFTDAGAFVQKWGPSSPDGAQFINPVGIAADCEGHIYVTDSRTQDVQEFTKGGTFVKRFGVGKFEVPVGIAVSSVSIDGCLDTDIYVADEHANRIAHFTASGDFVGYIGSYGTEKGQLSGPDQISLQRNPNTANLELWVAESGNMRIQQFVSTDLGATWQPHLLIRSGREGLSSPHGVTVDRTGRIIASNTGVGEIYWYKQAPPELDVKVLAFRKDIREGRALFVRIDYNQLDQSCQVELRVKVTVPPHAKHEFTLEATFRIGPDGRAPGLRLSDRRLDWIKEAWREDRFVSVEARGVEIGRAHV